MEKLVYMSEEYCNECENTFNMMSNKTCDCPDCGNIVYPCNACHTETTNCNECPFN